MEFAAAVVGPSGVGAIHSRELVRLGCRKLTIVSSSAASAARTAPALAAALGIDVDTVPDVAALAQRSPGFVSICSPTPLHRAHIEALAGAGAFLFVEKPLFWDSGNIEDMTTALLAQAKDRLLVNYPCASLAQAFVGIAASQAPREISFSYRTRGRNQDTGIAVDLLPHAISFVLTLLTATNAPDQPVADINTETGRHRWAAQLRIGATRCTFDLVNDPALPSSELEFEVDGLRVKRSQSVSGGEAAVGLDFGGAHHPVPNPMAEQVRYAINTWRSGGGTAAGDRFTHNVMSIMARLLPRRN